MWGLEVVLCTAKHSISQELEKNITSTAYCCQITDLWSVKQKLTQLQMQPQGGQKNLHD